MKIKLLTLGIYRNQKTNNSTIFGATRQEREERDRKIVEMYNQGAERKEISERIGLSKTRVYEILHRYGINIRERSDKKREVKIPKLTPEQELLVKENKKLVDFFMSPQFYQSISWQDPPTVRNLKYLIRSIIDEIKHDCAEYSEYEQAGEEALIKAASKYDPQKGSFSTYAFFWIAQGIVRLHKKKLKEKTKPKTISLDKGIGNKEDKKNLYSIIPDKSTTPVEEASKNEKIKKVFEIVDKLELSDKYNKIFEMRYREGKTLKEIGDTFGTT